ncbi:dihydrofolate reductase [Anaerosphaera multitolerans]|uniref:dihydrofolate reductase n=1 Tax=Anaerosphaera multitolerans TaxID=2487351 RepID=A0A437S980_9FIRM|nr:dihydrofolate reductase [Anaerosphaera multitolerans]RVU55669.1 dihydrofolate reductase [Anaerosphaera multitolerans]
MKDNMSLIFIADENWAIGLDGGLIVEIPEDLKRFKELTYGNIIIMGRRTFEALPNQRPLKGRTNIILTKSREIHGEDTYTVGSLEELDDLLNKLDDGREIFVIGGANVLKQLYNNCSKAYITKILKGYEKSDTVMINLDEDKNWKVVWESEIKDYKGIKYKYVDYERIGK